MTQSTWLIISAFIVIGLVPLVPKMIVLRIKILRWLRFRRLADWHERNARPLTLIVRATFVVISVVLLVTGLTGT